MFDLSGKIALITGASRGLGFSIARGLREHGATVILNGRDIKSLKEAASKICKEGKDIFSYPFDVTDLAAINENLDKIKTDVGSIDILVNNAGIQHREPLSQLDILNWEKVIQTNLTAPFLMAQAVSADMITKNAGKIINICSITSELGRENIAPYVSSKGGLKMLTKVMAVEWAKQNIQVNGIGPGYFRTEMNFGLVEDKKFNNWVCDRTPAGRWGSPEELIGTAVFLASRASDFITGQVIYVDGGFLASM